MHGQLCLYVLMYVLETCTCMCLLVYGRGLIVIFFWYHPNVGGEGEGPWFLPDILVNVRRSGEDPVIGVVRDVLQVCICLHVQQRIHDKQELTLNICVLLRMVRVRCL